MQYFFSIVFGGNVERLLICGRTLNSQSEEPLHFESESANRIKTNAFVVAQQNNIAFYAYVTQACVVNRDQADNDDNFSMRRKEGKIIMVTLGKCNLREFIPEILPTLLASRAPVIEIKR